ncbi:MBL fold metallo-hydrolase [Treponema sp.]|uniref:MBL fold metallo-hydrolase n=1 Tax=Treponema sp. TaxID=166 RepID=UPI00298E0FD6|nr:MBL fold metallo-hydrolase [Treponema sp.]MCR5613791.1 MBL fold metallo-hydrolase [Treponema sp.]
MAITLYSLGAAQEVTGSKHILEINGHSYMIDCGAFQGKRKESDDKNRNFDFPPDKLEAVILTHGHFDHCGLLPVLTKKGYKGNIYATPATRDLASLVMMDSARIQARDAEYLRKQAKKKGNKFTWTPIFDEEDCVKAANQIVTLSYNRPLYIGPEVQLEFHDAGHILGSAFADLNIRLPGQDDVRVLFTGDLGRKEKPIVRNPSIEVPAPDYVVLESTYGNRKHESKEFALHELVDIIKDAINKKGKIIIPSFAIERTQEIIYHLHLLVDQKKIPSIPIYVDSPMASNATSIFRVHPECYDASVTEAFLKHHKNPFGFGDLTFVTSVEESKLLNEKEGPMIIISADGMCEAGRILHHLANNIQDERNTILIVGYMAENTLGRKILEGEKEVHIMDSWYKVNAKVEKLNAFSAHADYTETLDWLKAIDTSKLKHIFLVHGETDAQDFLQNYLRENGFANTTIIKYGESYEL